MRLKLLDLFCCAGGAGMGYHRAGFDVTGVDITPQPRYPFAFVQADALKYVAEHGHEFDAIHASPPCQGYSRMRHLPWLKGRHWPLLIDATRQALVATGKPWIMENVADAPLKSGVVLCGTMFGLKLYRHRKFESSHVLFAPPHPRHTETIGAGSMFNDRQRASASGWVSTVSKGDRKAAEAAMEIDWMTRAELTEAIPPAFTEYLGRQLIAVLEQSTAA